MGCASSKRIEAAKAPYRPAPASFAVFDINAIEEPWLKHLNNTNPLPKDKPTLPTPILQKLNMFDTSEAPQSWDEVSKTLQELKPVIKKPPSPSPSPPQQPQPPVKNKSFRTLEELDAKFNSKPEPKKESKGPTEMTRKINEARAGPIEVEGGNSIKPVKDNIFIVRDRLERQKGEKESTYERLRRDPLSEFPERCPPGGNDAVVIYTTSLGGVRKTFEDCNRAREVLEGHRVVYDERDVSLHGEFLREMKELVEEGVALPRVFVKGRYVGGIGELVELNESGRLGRILNATRVERGVGRQACGGCGGARFVPCLDCGGSCKIVVYGGDKERCPKCNENGLVLCPACV
ncbi:glutaredoxin domain-containing cysteine-rich protein CG12206 [Abrus precatorius]|uniref:Glutaredoxin domain-containing cysteine-rich protein CG12206 n=1 Tax=Abrus precatorius TaxID=3816 RepID=A0A8B8KFG6_ABRPR|nr:glutaredoxin domain-containing cysteine-rich protein CG12206 [Abrus precatorius]